MPKKYSYHRSKKNSNKGRRDRKSKIFYEKPRIDPSLKPSFKKIGIPEPTPIIPDPFQLEALAKLKDCDVLVTAPTGSGKTWIAIQAIHQYMEMGLKVWYASPLKALSNSLYNEFNEEFGHTRCGILTGDRRENSNASIIVGTTEILRNQLYDAMFEGKDIDTDLVILDEAHYLSDPDRGVVWEEVMIYLPSRVRLLLLSATVSNAREICLWLERNRKNQNYVVQSSKRAVPLELLFLFPDGLISPLSGNKGLATPVKKFLISQDKGRRRRWYIRPKYGEILKCLKKFDLLPAIFFLKSRNDCDNAIFTCRNTRTGKEQKRQMRQYLNEILKEYPHLKDHKHLKPLMDSGVASHHAGQLPYWKILIEKMMNKGYLNAIFSTSTVAAGVNYPARTVVLIQSDRFNGHEFADLSATDLHQMIGRAGRRGKDNIGFSLIIPGEHQNPVLINDLKDSPPDPLMSQIKINFSMTLNLLMSHSPSAIKNLLDQSFATFQQKRSGGPGEENWKNMEDSLKWTLPEAKCDTSDPYEVLEHISISRELGRQSKRTPQSIDDELQFNQVKPYLVPGRLFHHRKKGVFALFKIIKSHDSIICASHNIKRQLRLKKGRIKLRKIPLEKIKLLYDYKVDIPGNYLLEELQNIFSAINISRLEILDTEFKVDSVASKEAAASSELRLNLLPCTGCSHVKDCHSRKNRHLGTLLRDFRAFADNSERMGEGLWISFKRHLRFLKETNFVKEDDSLTDDGIWASKLRLDQPLLIAEAIRKGGFNDLTPEVLAGSIAPFVWDRDQDVDLRIGGSLDISSMENAFERVLESMNSVRSLKSERGFNSPEIMFWPAAAIYMWSKGVPWESLLFMSLWEKVIWHLLL